MFTTNRDKIQKHKGVGMLLRFRRHDDLDHPDDVTYIVNTLAEAGVRITSRDAQDAWQAHSDSLCAGWLMVSDLDAYQILCEIGPYCEKIADGGED